jgi:hypothetical protein
MRVALVLPFCVFTTLAPAADWPEVKYAEVRAYYYNASSAHDCRIIDQKGKLDASVANKDGILLNPAQVALLLSAINGRQRAHPITACYVPHHAFIFYSAWGRRVAVFEFCLECLKASVEPNTTGPYYDYPALAELVADLNLPLGPKFRNPRAYRRRYERMLQSQS